MKRYFIKAIALVVSLTAFGTATALAAPVTVRLGKQLTYGTTKCQQGVYISYTGVDNIANYKFVDVSQYIRFDSNPTKYSVSADFDFRRDGNNSAPAPDSVRACVSLQRTSTGEKFQGCETFTKDPVCKAKGY